MDCERQTEDFRGEGVGEGGGGRGSLAMGSREGTYCMVHWVLYATNEAFTSESGDVLCGD